MAKKIKVSVFNDLKMALRNAAAYERGQSVKLVRDAYALTAETTLPKNFSIATEVARPSGCRTLFSS